MTFGVATWRLVEGGGRKAPRQLLFVPASGASHQMPYALRSAITSLARSYPFYKTGSSLGTQPGHGHAPPDLELFSHLNLFPFLPSLQNGARRHLPRLQIAPQRHQKLARQGHDPHPARTTIARAESLPVPPTQLTLRLPAQPTPRNLDRHRSHPDIAGAIDPLLAVQAVAAAVRSRRQAGQPTHLAPIAELPPSEKLHHEQPRAVDPDGPQQQQLTDLDLGPTGGLHHPLAPLRLQPLDLRLHELQTLQLPLETSSQIRRQRTAVPQPDRLESPTNPATARAHRHSLRCQKPPDPVAMLRPLLLQRLQLPAQLTTVFLRHARHPHHAPHLLLPRVVPQQQAQQLDPIQLVRLRPPLPTIHLDTRGVHHLILHTDRH